MPHRREGRNRCLGIKGSRTTSTATRWKHKELPENCCRKPLCIPMTHTMLGEAGTEAPQLCLSISANLMGRIGPLMPGVGTARGRARLALVSPVETITLHLPASAVLFFLFF